MNTKKFIDTFIKEEYDDQLEVLSNLWNTDEDMFYACLETFPEKNRNQVMHDMENGVRYNDCAYDKIVDSVIQSELLT